MATKNHGKLTKVYLNGYDLTSVFNKSSLAGSGEALDATVFGDNSKEFKPGLTDDKITLEGFHTFAGTPNFDGSDDVLNGALNVVDGLLVFFQGDAVGLRGRGMAPIDTDLSIDSPATGLITAKADLQASNGPEPVLSLHALAAEVATGNGTGVDEGATWNGVAMPSTFGLSAFLQVSALAGATPGVTVKLQHSVDNVTFADLSGGAFTLVTVARNAQRIDVAGNVNRYVRCVFTLQAGTTSATFVAAYRRKSN